MSKMSTTLYESQVVTGFGALSFTYLDFIWLNINLFSGTKPNSKKDYRDLDADSDRLVV